jgi:hypothetical protein
MLCSLLLSRANIGATIRNGDIGLMSIRIEWYICHTVYERAKCRNLQEERIFKRELTSNVDYNQDMEVEMEGLYGDEEEAIKMTALHGRNVPDDK